MAKKRPRPTRLQRVGSAMASPFGDQPWYVRAIAVVGIPGAGLGFMLWFFTNLFTALTTRMDAIEAGLRSSEKVQLQLLQHLQADDEQMWQLVSINQRTCLNTGKTDADKLGCVIARRGQ